MDRMLLEVALQLGATLDVDQLAEVVVERLVDLLKAERAFFLIYGHDGTVERLVLHGFEGTPTTALGVPTSVSSTIIEQCRNERRVIVVPDAQVSPDFRGRHSVQDLQIRFLMTAPVVARDGVVGIIYVDSRQIGIRSSRELEQTMTALSQMIGLAVENARLFEDQLFRNTLLSVMTHDLRNLLTVIHGSTRSLSTDHDPAVQDLLGAAQAMHETIESTCTLARNDRKASPSRVIDLSTFLEDFFNSFRHYTSSSELQFVVECESGLVPWVYADRLRTILWNLSFNALHHAHAGSKIQVQVRKRADAGPGHALSRPPGLRSNLFQHTAPLVAMPGSLFVEINMHNTGIPIDPDLLPMLFRAGIRSPTSNGGLGLAIVDACVRSMGGAVWAASDAQSGTQFTFTLPLLILR